MSDIENQLFEALAIKHMDSLYSKAIRLTGSAKEAENLVQQTYAAARYIFVPFVNNSDFNELLSEILMLIYTNTHPYLQQLADNCLGKAA